MFTGWAGYLASQAKDIHAQMSADVWESAQTIRTQKTQLENTLAGL